MTIYLFFMCNVPLFQISGEASKLNGKSLKNACLLERQFKRSKEIYLVSTFSKAGRLNGVFFVLTKNIIIVSKCA